LDTVSVKGVSLDASLDINVPITLNAAVEQKGLDIARLWPRLSRVFPIEGLSVKGDSHIQSAFKLTIPEGEPPHLTGTADLTLTSGGFSSPDGTKIGEGIAMEFKSSFALSLPLTKARFSVNAQAKDFELLLGRFYGDFTKMALVLSVDGEYLKDLNSVEVDRAELSLADIATLNVEGEVKNLTTSPIFDAEIRLIRLSNREAYDLFVRETFQESLPFLSRLKIDGTSSMVLKAKGSKEVFDVSGQIEVMDADIIAKEEREVEGSDITVTGINLTLPVQISWPEVPSPESPVEFGSLRVRSVAWGAIRFKELEVFPALWQNAVFFREDITLPVLGGSMRIKDLRYKDIIGPGRALFLSMDIDGIDLAELSVALGMPRFAGSFSGTIPKVNLAGTSLLTEGEVKLKLFGGEMNVSEISISDIFSPVAALTSDIEFKEIDLSKLTGTFEFGHISGILQGSVKGLVIANGQPESFQAHIETVKKSGVGQKIGVEALDKISIMGTGSSASILKSGIYRFFEEYNYSKMGFRGRLKNDNFLLLGIETEGDKGYLVKGALLPPKVDVISYIQNISFKEMVERLKRVKLVGAAEGVRVE
jgi:hypothetical protein